MIFIVTVAAILFLDQASKFLITQTLPLNHSLPVIKDIFHLSLIYNRGAAFGMFKGQSLLFICTSLIAITLIYLNLKNANQKKLSIYNLSLCLILAGGLGNLIDRLFFGYVIDFLDFRIWPVFNIADSSITIGAVLLGWSIIRPPKA